MPTNKRTAATFSAGPPREPLPPAPPPPPLRCGKPIPPGLAAALAAMVRGVQQRA